MAALLDRICPCCGAVWGPIVDPERDEQVTPREGDLFFCPACQTFCRFLADGTLRPPSPAEQEDDRRAPRRLRSIAAWMRWHSPEMPNRIGRT